MPEEHRARRLVEAARQRLAENVRRGEPDECWPWTGKTVVKGYGQLRVAGRHEMAHRFTLSLKLGRPIEPGKWALHTCDNSICCNPAHLYEGTRADNERDRVDRDRFPRGDEHGKTIVSNADVVRLREEAASTGDSTYVLAGRYGITSVQVGNIITGRARADLPGPLRAPGRKRGQTAVTVPTN